MRRKFQSLQNLTHKQTDRRTDGPPDVDNLKQVFESAPRKTRSVSFDASVQELYYDDQAAPNTAVKDIISRYKNRAPRASSENSSSDGSYSYSDSSADDSSAAEDEPVEQIPERLI